MTLSSFFPLISLAFSFEFSAFDLLKAMDPLFQGLSLFLVIFAPLGIFGAGDPLVLKSTWLLFPIELPSVV